MSDIQGTFWKYDFPSASILGLITDLTKADWCEINGSTSQVPSTDPAILDL